MPAQRKLAMVTGASTGIGRAIGLALAEAGWDIAFNHLHSESAAEEAARAMAAAGAQVLESRSDVGISTEVEQFHAAVVERFGRSPDLLVNNAGTQTWSSLLELEEAQWDRVIRTNLKGCFLNTQRFARSLVSQGRGGAVINIGSGCNKVPFPNLVAYSASKGAVELLTRVAAVELGPHRITVNCVAPGAIEIERTRNEMPEYAVTWSKITPLRRVGQPSDVANAVVFLASDRAAFITGQTLWVDGGVFTAPNWPLPD